MEKLQHQVVQLLNNVSLHLRDQSLTSSASNRAANVRAFTLITLANASSMKECAVNKLQGFLCLLKCVKNTSVRSQVMVWKWVSEHVSVSVWCKIASKTNHLTHNLMNDVGHVLVVMLKGFVWFDAYLTWSSFSVWDLSLHTFTFISAFSSSSCWTLWGEIIHYKVCHALRF